MTTPLERLQQLREEQSAPPPSVFTQRRENAAPAPDVLRQSEDGQHRVVRGEGGLQYVGPSFATRDPGFIASFIAGADPDELTRTWVNEGVIEGNPVAARGVKALEGVPGIGSRVDEASGFMSRLMERIGIGSGNAETGVRALSNAMEEERPGESAALQIGGTVASIPAIVATGGLLGGRMAASSSPAAQLMTRALTLAPNATRGARVAQGAALGAAGGAAEGALYGSGQQQGDGRLSNALWQGAFGGGAGGAFGGIAPMAFDGAQAVYQFIRGTPINEAAEQLGTSPGAVRLFASLMDEGRADDAMQAIGRRSDDMLAYDLPEVADYVAANSGTAGNTVRRAINSDTAERMTRFTGAMDETLGEPRGRLFLQDDIMTGSRAARGANYENAYSRPIDYASEAGQRLEGMFGRVPQAAWRRAREMMQADGVESAQRLFRMADDGSVEVLRMPDVRELDYIARGLRDVARDSVTGRVTTDIGRSYDNLGREIRQLLGSDELVPEYRQALDTASDAIGRREAVDTGAGLLSLRRDQAEFAVSRMNPAERQSAMQGLRSFIDDKIAEVRAVASRPTRDEQAVRQAEETLRQLSSQRSRANIRSLLGDEAADRFFASFDELTRGLSLQASTARNSQTFARQAMDRNVADATAPSFLEGVTDVGNLPGAMQTAARALTGNMGDAQLARRMEMLDEIANALTQIRGDDAMQAVQIVNQARLGAQVTDEQALRVARVLSQYGALGGHQATLQGIGSR